MSLAYLRHVLRITTEETGKTVRFLLEGKLSGPWVAEFQRVIDATVTAIEKKEIVVDVNGLSGADAAGRILLAWLRQSGAVMQIADPLSASLLNVGLYDAGAVCAAKS